MSQSKYYQEVGEVAQQGIWDYILPKVSMTACVKDAIVDSLPDLKQQLQSLGKNLFSKDATKLNVGFGDNWFTLVTEIILTAYAIVNARDWLSVTAIVIPFLLHRNISFEITNKFMEYFKGLVADDVPVQQSGAIDWVKAKFDRFKEFIFVTLHLLTEYKLPSKKTILEFCRNLHFISSGVNAIKNLWGIFQYVFVSFSEWIYKKITGTNLREDYDGLEQWMIEVPTLNKEIAKSQDHRDLKVKIVNLLEKGVLYQPLAYKLRMKHEYDLRMTLLRTALTKVESVIAKTESVIPPFLVYIYGDSGLGKSTMIQKLAAEFVLVDPAIKSVHERIDVLSRLDQFMYHRNSETKYYDGLDFQHFIAVYDDIFQNVDTRGTPNVELMELIRSVGTAPVLPHMASLSDKGLFHLHFRLIICTSNVSEPQPMESISCGTAVMNRIGNCKYNIKGKLGNVLFDKLDEKNKIIKTNLTEEQMIEDYKQSIVAWGARQVKVKEEKDKYIQNLVTSLIEKEIETHNEIVQIVNEDSDDECCLTESSSSIEVLPSTSDIVQQNGLDKLNDKSKYYQAQMPPLSIVQYLMIRRIKKYKDQCLLNCNNEVCAKLRNIYDLHKLESESIISSNMALEIYKFDIADIYRSLNCCNMKDLSEEHSCTEIILKKKTIMEKVYEWYGDSKWRKAIMWLIENLGSGGSFLLSLGIGVGITKLFEKFISRAYYWFNEKRLSQTALRPDNVEFYYLNNTWMFMFKNAFRLKHKLPMMMFSVDEFLDFKSTQNVVKNADELLKLIQTREGNLLLNTNAGPVVKYLDGHGITQERASYNQKDVLTRKVDLKMPSYIAQEACSDPNYPAIKAKFDKNIYNIAIPKGDTIFRAGTITGLKGKTFLTFGHLIPALAKERNIVVFKKNERHDMYVADCQVVPLFNDCDVPVEIKMLQRVMSVHEYTDLQRMHPHLIRDAVLLILPKMQNHVADLTNHIITFADISSIIDSDHQLVNYYGEDKIETATFVPRYGCDEQKNNGDESTFVLDKYLEYLVTTEKGSCGSPVFNLNARVQRKYVGIHVAGYQQINKGLAVVIYKELLDDAFTTIEPVQKMGYVEIDPLTYFEDFTLCEGIRYEGHLSKTVIKSTETQFEHSKLVGVLDEPKKELMKLGVWVDGDVVRDPYMEGIVKYAGRTQGDLPNIDVIPSVYNNICSRSMYSLKPFKRLLTLEEAIFGHPKLKFLNGLNRNSSPGFGWPKHGMKGKNYWIRGELNNAKNPIYINPKLKHMVEYRINLAKQNTRLQTLYILTTKDEKKKIGGKTRLFTNPPMDYTIACRMYFGAFIAWYLENHVNNFSLIGINMYDTTVDYIGRKLEIYKNIIAGDFSNYDGHERADVLWKVLDFIELWYKGSQQDIQVRRILYTDLVNSQHICWSFVYQLSRSVPSGHPLTTVVNTLYNIILNVYVYLYLVPPIYRSIRDYFSNVCGFYYGDDHLIGVKDRVKEYLTYENFTRVYAIFGHVYTTSHKEEIIAGHKHDTLKDVIILKRHIMQMDGHYIASLEKPVISEILNWCKKENNTFSQIFQNIDNVCREAALWGPDYYAEVVYKIDNKLKTDFDITFDFEPYQLILDKVVTLGDVEWVNDF